MSDKAGAAIIEGDLEANVSASSQTSETKQKEEDQEGDVNIVDWDVPDDPKNPMN